MLTRNPSILIVLTTIMINMMGVGLMWPILPSLVKELTGSNISGTAITYGAIAIVFSVMQFLFAPVLGALSDRYGRRPVMLIALLGLGFDTLLLAFAPTVFWVFIGRALGGIFGATFSIASAYIADTTSEKDRAAGFGLIGAAFGIGFIIGPLMGGILGEYGLRMPFYAAAALSFINFAFGYFFLKETLPPEKRSTNKPFRANPLRSLGLMAANQVLLLLGFTLLLVNSTQRGMEALWALFAGFQYGWGPWGVGVSLAVVGVSFVFVQGFLVKHVIARFGEVNTIIGGFILSAIMYVILAFNTSGLIALIGIPIYVLGWGCAAPALQAIASKHAPPDQQGELQGAWTAVSGLAAIVGPGIATFSFAFFTSPAAPAQFPGAYFLLGALVFVISAIIGRAIGRSDNSADTKA